MPPHVSSHGEFDWWNVESVWAAAMQFNMHCRYILLSLSHRFNGPLSGTTQVSRYQKGTTNLDFPEARDSD